MMNKFSVFYWLVFWALLAYGQQGFSQACLLDLLRDNSPMSVDDGGTWSVLSQPQDGLLSSGVLIGDNPCLPLQLIGCGETRLEYKGESSTCEDCFQTATLPLFLNCVPDPDRCLGTALIQGVEPFYCEGGSFTIFQLGAFDITWTAPNGDQQTSFFYVIDDLDQNDEGLHTLEGSIVVGPDTCVVYQSFFIDVRGPGLFTTVSISNPPYATFVERQELRDNAPHTITVSADNQCFGGVSDGDELPVRITDEDGTTLAKFSFVVGDPANQVTNDSAGLFVANFADYIEPDVIQLADVIGAGADIVFNKSPWADANARSYREATFDGTQWQSAATELTWAFQNNNGTSSDVIVPKYVDGFSSFVSYEFGLGALYAQPSLYSDVPNWIHKPTSVEHCDVEITSVSGRNTAFGIYFETDPLVTINSDEINMVWNNGMTSSYEADGDGTEMWSITAQTAEEYEIHPSSEPTKEYHYDICVHTDDSGYLTIDNGFNSTNYDVGCIDPCGDYVTPLMPIGIRQQMSMEWFSFLNAGEGVRLAYQYETNYAF